MIFPCELLTRPFMVTLRQEVAKALKDMSLTQQEIADLLQVSQPVVSSYQKSDYDVNDPLYPIIAEASKQISIVLRSNSKGKEEQAIAIGCMYCKKLRQGSLGCGLHRHANPYIGPNCTACHTQSDLLTLQVDREGILQALRQMLDFIRQRPKLHFLIPEIGLQIGYAPKTPSSTFDIAAFPNRIVKRKNGRLLADPPEFGGSNTLSQTLLVIHQFNSSVRVGIGVKTTPSLKSRAEQNSMPVIAIRGFDLDPEQHLETLQSKDIQFPLLVYDEGTIGLEAISYLFASSPSEMKTLLLKLLPAN